MARLHGKKGLKLTIADRIGIFLFRLLLWLSALLAKLAACIADSDVVMCKGKRRWWWIEVKYNKWERWPKNKER